MGYSISLNPKKQNEERAKKKKRQEGNALLYSDMQSYVS